MKFRRFVLPRPTCNRRTALKAFAWAVGAAAWPEFARGQNERESRGAVLEFLESLARPDGGYAWPGQDRSHLTPTYFAVGCQRLLGIMPPRREVLIRFIRTHHPRELKKLEQERGLYDFQQIQALVWLNEDASEFTDLVLAHKQPRRYLPQYEKNRHPIFQSELCAFHSRALLGLPLDDLKPHFTEYLESRRRDHGTFNNTPASEGGDGHVLNTWWGLQAARVIGREAPNKERTVAWLRDCQLESGGFTYQPDPPFGGLDDIAYTWAAVRALQALGAVPARREACIRWVHSLANAEGGFSDRPGWQSNPMATYYALDTLHALEPLNGVSAIRRRTRPVRALPANLKVYSIQLEAHGQGSPAEAVDLAGSLRLHLWGAKNSRPGWIERAQAIADERNVPVRFFVSNEEYGTWVNVPGLGTYSHTSDIMAPAGRELGESLAQEDPVSWPEFRERRLAPLQKAGGGLVWQFGENEELVRIYLDDSLQRGGYEAISTFHFGNPDFTNTEPFLHRWRGQIPFVALQDAHGIEPWWAAELTGGFRTVFLAEEPTWEGWRRALRENWVMAIRHDAVSGFQTWMHGGSDEVVNYVLEHARDWRWWDNDAIARPWVSIVPVRPEDIFEAERPERGLTLRVRCAWSCTVHGILKEPLVELTRLTVDGQPVDPQLATVKASRGNGLADRYHHVHRPEPRPGRHTATAEIKLLQDGSVASRTISFVV